MPKNDWGNRGNQKSVEGTRETISLLSGNREHCKRLRKITFLHRKAKINLFSKICYLVQQNPSALCIYDISSTSQTTAYPLSGSN